MAGGEGHFVESRRVPSAHKDPAILRIVFDGLDALGQLIDALAGIIRVHVLPDQRQVQETIFYWLRVAP